MAAGALLPKIFQTDWQSTSTSLVPMFAVLISLPMGTGVATGCTPCLIIGVGRLVRTPGGRYDPPLVRLDVFPPLQKVSMAVRPILDGLIPRLAVLHRGIDGSDVRERYVDARQNFTRVRVFFRKALVPDPIVALRRRINALRILEELHIELLDHSGWLPDGCNNPLIAVDRRLQRCRHCCRAALHELELEAVILHGLRRITHQSSTRL